MNRDDWNTVWFMFLVTLFGAFGLGLGLLGALSLVIGPLCAR